MPHTRRHPVLLFLFMVSALAFQPAYGGGELPAAAHPFSSFSPPVNVSNSPTSNSGSARIVRAADGALHAAWQEGDRPAYAKGDGTSWQAWEWIVPPTGPAYSQPELALDSGGNVHVAMSYTGAPPFAVAYTTKAFTGTWSTPITVSQEASSSSYPAIAVDRQDGVWIAWQTELSDTNTEIYTRYRPAGGVWGPIMRVTDNAGQDLDPSLAVDSSDVAHLVWRSNRAGAYDIFYSRYEGGSWTLAENLSDTGSYSIHPDLAADGAGDVYAVWADEIGGVDHFQILCRRWDGSVWLPWTYVSSPLSPRVMYPAIAADDSGNLYVVWDDYLDDPQQPEIYFSHSTDYGATWLGDEDVSQNATGSYFPDVAAQPEGYAHIVWQDISPGQFDIFYSRARVPAFAGEERFYLPAVRK